MIDINSLNLIEYTIYLSTIFALSLLWLKKVIWNIIDPLILLIFNISFNVVNVVYFSTHSGDYCQSVGFVIISYVLFLFGLKYKFVITYNINQNKIYLGPGRNATIFLLFFLFFFEFIRVAFLFKSVGLGIITGSITPDVKSTMTMNGLGVFKYLMIISQLLFWPLIFHAYFIHRFKYFFYFSIFWFISTSLLFNMSKSGFFFLLFDFGIILYYFKDRFPGFKFPWKKVFIFSFLGLVPAFIALSFYVKVTKSSLLILLLERFIDTGGGTYSYFVKNGMNAFNDFSFLERLRYYFDTLLSVFRFKPWENPNYMGLVRLKVEGLFMPGYGQNPYMFLNGHFLFGLFGIFYSFFLGFLINYIRTLRSVNLIWYYFLIKASFALVADPDITQSYIVALLIFSPIILFLSLSAKIQNVKIIQAYSI